MSKHRLLQYLNYVHYNPVQEPEAHRLLQSAWAMWRPILLEELEQTPEWQVIKDRMLQLLEEWEKKDV